MSKLECKVVKVLECAQRMVGDGWIQGIESDYLGGVLCRCATRAIRDALFVVDPGLTSKEHDILGSAVRSAFTAANGLPSGGMSIPHWNDAPGRTKRQVVAAFSAAIRHVEGKTKV